MEHFLLIITIFIFTNPYIINIKDIFLSKIKIKDIFYLLN